MPSICILLFSRDCIHGLGVSKLKEAYDILDEFEADDLEASMKVSSPGHFTL